jgi:5-methylcytosine-specific restriction enzyme subunit McrC
MARLIQVFEHERLTRSPNERKESLSKSELDKLYEFNDKNENKYFTGIRDGIKFNHFVGVIQIGGLTIEILPKADKKTTTTKEDFAKWRSALLNMLAICRKIKLESVSEASLNKRYYSLLDLYFDLFLDEVMFLLRNGLIKKYHNQSSNSVALKGRIIFSKQIQQNLIHQERFYTSHQVYDYEHTINQILLKALNVLSNIVTNTNIKERVARVNLDFPEIREVEITKAHFDSIKETRKTEPYKEALKIAKMIILNYSPDIRNGQEDMLALLFDMNKLWEEFIYRMLLRNNDSTLSVNFQNSQAFWEGKTIRPDLVISKTASTGKVDDYIIDTKWKIIDANNPADDDLKQMFAYNIFWDAGKSILLYPKTKDQVEKFGKFHKGKLGENHCKLGFIDVLDGTGALNQNIASDVLAKLEICF